MFRDKEIIEPFQGRRDSRTPVEFVTLFSECIGDFCASPAEKVKRFRNLVVDGCDWMSLALKSNQDFQSVVRSFINAFWAASKQKSLTYAFDAAEYDENHEEP